MVTARQLPEDKRKGFLVGTDDYMTKPVDEEVMYLYWRLWWQADIPMPQFWRPIPLLAVLSAVLGTGLALLVSRIPLKPIRRLIDAINQLADGDFHVRIHLDLTEEFVRLSDSFNRMAQELENTELLRSDFINNFPHEFKTPIVSLRALRSCLKTTI